MVLLKCCTGASCWSAMLERDAEVCAEQSCLLSQQQPTLTYITKAPFPWLVYVTSVLTIVHLVRDWVIFVPLWLFAGQRSVTFGYLPHCGSSALVQMLTLVHLPPTVSKCNTSQSVVFPPLVCTWQEVSWVLCRQSVSFDVSKWPNTWLVGPCSQWPGKHWSIVLELNVFQV